jgi:hypothetical protein
MHRRPLDYSSGGSPRVRLNSGERENAGRSFAWASVIAGLVADGGIAPMMATRDSIGGALLSAAIWLVSGLSLILAVWSAWLWRRGRVAWLGMLMGSLAFAWSTAFMWIPPARRDF